MRHETLIFHFMGQRLFETFYWLKVFSKIMRANKVKKIKAPNLESMLTLGIGIVLWLIIVLMVSHWVEPVRN